MNFKTPFKVLTTAALIGTLSLSAVAPGAASAAEKTSKTVQAKAELAASHVVLKDAKGNLITLDYNTYLEAKSVGIDLGAEPVSIKVGDKFYNLNDFLEAKSVSNNDLAKAVDLLNANNLAEEITPAEGSIKDGALVTTPSETEKDFKVTEVAAINPTTATVTFNKEVDALAKADVTVTNKETNVKQLVKSVELAKDGKSATVTFYDALKSGTKYTVAVKDAGSVELAYAVGVPTTIVAETTQVFAAPGTTEKVAYKVLDENGLDITSTTTDVEFQSTSDAVNATTGVVDATALAGKSAFVYVVVAKEDGTELKSERITVKAEAAKAAVIKDFTVGSSANFTATDYKQNTKVAVTDKTKSLFVQAENQFGKDFPTAGKVSFESLDLDVAVVDAANGKITPLKEGKFAVKVTVGTVSKTVELEVVAESKATTVEVDKTEVTLSNKATTPATVKVSVKDQNGIKMSGVSTTATATTTAGKALINVSEVTDGEFTISPKDGVKSGTATVEVKVNDTVKTTLVVTITEAGEVDAYELKGFKAELDKNVDETNLNQSAALSVIPVDANGAQSGEAVEATYIVTDEEGTETELESAELTATDYTVGETYKLTVKVGTVTVATETFTVVDSTPQPELEFTATTVKDANLNGNLFDDIAGKLSATLGEKTYTVADTNNKLEVTSIKFISTDSTVVESATATNTITVLKPGKTNLLIGEVTVTIGENSYTIDMKNFKLVADVTSAQTAPADSVTELTSSDYKKLKGITAEDARFFVAPSASDGTTALSLEQVKQKIDEGYADVNFNKEAIKISQDDNNNTTLKIDGKILSAEDWAKIKENGNKSVPYRITLLVADHADKEKNSEKRALRIAIYADGTAALQDNEGKAITKK